MVTLSPSRAYILIILTTNALNPAFRTEYPAKVEANIHYNREPRPLNQPITDQLPTIQPIGDLVVTHQHCYVVPEKEAAGEGEASAVASLLARL